MRGALRGLPQAPPDVRGGAREGLERLEQG